GDPRRRVVERGCPGSVVARGCGHEDARDRRAEEGVVDDRVRALGGTAADRVVDHVDAIGDGRVDAGEDVLRRAAVVLTRGRVGPGPAHLVHRDLGRRLHDAGDRKSTRLNSSHVKNAYAVFRLKKKRLQALIYLG